jgi:hypothetical protein
LPLPILAHQAPVLPLKLWRPAAWNGTALVIGSIAPDLEYVLLTGDVRANRGFAHGVVGQLVFCLPVTLALVLLIGRFGLGEVLVARMGARFAWLAGAATDVRQAGGLRRACVSALVGSFSHVALDKLTHRVLPRWLPVHRAHLGRLSFTTPTIVQLVVSCGCVLVALWLLVRIARLPVPPAPAARPGRALIAALALVGSAVALFHARPVIRNPDAYFDAGPLYVWGHIAFVAVCGAGTGALLAGTLLAAWDRRARAPRAA